MTQLAILCAATTLLLSGCFLLPGDGYLRVRGKVTDEHNKPFTNCEVALDNDYLVKPRMPDGIFETGTVGPPGRYPYTVTVSCEGASSPFRKRVMIGGQAPTDLGHIMLRRK